jgi:hypothetical protein
MAATATLINDIKTLGESITKELSKDDPSSSHCLELLATLSSTLSVPPNNNSSNSNSDQINMTSVLEQTLIGKTLTKAVKSFKRHKRTSTTIASTSSTTTQQESDHPQWQACVQTAETLIANLKQTVSREHANMKAKKEQESRDESIKPGLPKSVAAYRARLVSQNKEMYKDPPVLPPPCIMVQETFVSLPTRSDGKDGTKGEFTFVCGEDTSIAKLIQEFKPNCSPEEILRAGGFGGTYFRPIVSAVTNIRYKSAQVLESTVRPEWIQGLDTKTYLTSNTYSSSINKYKVKCGGSLGMWESSGWIADCDPYGWFQWYCRFYQGRRCSDDERQIGRWLKSAGPKGRFRSQLCNKILAAGGMSHVQDERISPVIRQTLLHWGLEVTESILKQHGKRIGKKS